MVTLIGLNGRKGSGKDTVFEIIRGFRPYAKRIAFADKMKVAAAKTLGFNGSDDELIATMNDAKVGWEIDGYATNSSVPMVQFNISGREYLQNFGASMRETYGDNFWIDLTLPIQKWDDQRFVVVTDVRYWNEAKAIKDLGGKIWFIHRAGASDELHLSEYPIAEHLIDECVFNNGSVDDLVKEVKKYL